MSFNVLHSHTFIMSHWWRVAFAYRLNLNLEWFWAICRTHTRQLATIKLVQWNILLSPANETIDCIELNRPPYSSVHWYTQKHPPSQQQQQQKRQTKTTQISGTICLCFLFFYYYFHSIFDSPGSFYFCKSDFINIHKHTHARAWSKVGCWQYCIANFMLSSLNNFLILQWIILPVIFSDDDDGDDKFPGKTHAHCVLLAGAVVVVVAAAAATDIVWCVLPSIWIVHNSIHEHVHSMDDISIYLYYVYVVAVYYFLPFHRFLSPSLFQSDALNSCMVRQRSNSYHM